LVKSLTGYRRWGQVYGTLLFLLGKTGFLHYLPQICQNGISTPCKEGNKSEEQIMTITISPRTPETGTRQIGGQTGTMSQRCREEEKTPKQLHYRTSVMQRTHASIRAAISFFFLLSLSLFVLSFLLTFFPVLRMKDANGQKKKLVFQTIAERHKVLFFSAMNNPKASVRPYSHAQRIEYQSSHPRRVSNNFPIHCDHNRRT
jgi:hypothetical protein